MTSYASKLALVICPAARNEIPFCAKAWKESLRHGPAGAHQDRKAYYDRVNPLVNDLLERSRLLVARDAEDPSFLYGFLAYEADSIVFTGHFVYTKYAFRRQGVANSLLARALEINPKCSELVYTTPPTRFDSMVEGIGFQHSTR